MTIRWEGKTIQKCAINYQLYCLPCCMKKTNSVFSSVVYKCLQVASNHKLSQKHFLKRIIDSIARYVYPSHIRACILVFVA